MDIVSFLPLIYNAALLLLLIYIYSFILQFGKSAKSGMPEKLNFTNIAIGTILGVIGILIMMTPWQYAPGIVFDARSVLLAISGLFFGVIPTIIAMTLTALMRLFEGGVGTIVGIAVIISSGSTGLLWRHFRISSLEETTSREFFMLGLTVHVTMLALMLFLPGNTAYAVLSSITLPVLLIFPACVVLLGNLLVNILRSQKGTHALAESEFLFHTQFDLGNIGIAITSPDKKWLRINQHLCYMLGYSEDELKQLSWVELTHPDDLQTDMVQFKQMLSGELDFYELDKRFYRKDGEVIFTHLNVSCYRDNGSIEFFIATLLDITTTRKSEEILRNSEKKYHDLIANLTEAIFTVSVDGELLQYNLELTRVMDLDPDKDHTGIFMPDFWQKPGERKNFIEKLLSNTVIKDYDINAITAKGREITIQLNARMVKDVDGIPLRIEGTFLDITQRKAAEIALRKSETHLRTMVEEAPMGIAVMDSRTGKFIEANVRYAEILGFTLAELETIDWMSITHPADIQQDLDKMALVNAGKSSGFRMEKRYISPDGEIVWVNMAVAALNLEGESQHRHLAMIADITQLKQVEESLRESESTIRNQLKALQQPEGDIGTLRLSDIIDVEALNSMMDDFYQLTGMVGAILDTSGEILVEVGQRDICKNFHRCNPDTLKNCIESDTILSSGVAAGTFKAYLCKNNMWDMVTPIIIGDKHVGNVFVGPFFYSDEEPDKKLFRDQAHRYGFDEKSYLTALNSAPRFSREEVNTGMRFYARLAGIVSTLSYSSIRQSRMLAQQQQTELKLHKNLEDTLRAITLVVEARDPYTAGHEQRVADIATAIAQEMGLDEAIVEGVYWGSMIHDIGKISVPAEILSKPLKLTDLEFGLIKGHPVVGYEIIKGIDFQWPVANIVRQHHERIDGSGYPDGLKGDEICLEARIVCVADLVEAMSSHRPYRAARGFDAALDELKKNRGILYEAEVVDACIRAYEKNRFSLPD